jgi:hypothetical protein
LTEGLGAGILGWVFGEPLDDAGHVRLERTRNGEIKNSSPDVTAILEVVCDSTGNKNE